MDVDLKQFWEDDALAHQDNCFSAQAPQVALGIRMSEECVYAELGVEGSPWKKLPHKEQLELNKRYNEKALKIVGKKLLREDFPPEDAIFPEVRQIGEVFEGSYHFTESGSWWLTGNCDNEKELEQMLNRVDTLDIESFILPPHWEKEKKRIFEEYGTRPSPFRSVRGPVTLATSIYGVENLIFLYYDAPELYTRFSQTILRVIKEYIDIMAREAGYPAGSLPTGFSFYDDDCFLLTEEMYSQFGLPVLQDIFQYVSPNPEDWRYQHSDSAMGHLLPVLSTLDLTACNFGPTLTIDEIRHHMPHTRIDGQLAPFTFMKNNPEEIIAEVRRDCAMAKEKRGVNLTTAGSINNGSLLTSMRIVMATIQEYGRY